MFPIASEFYKSLTIGVKQNYWRGDYFNGAVYGAFMLWEKLFVLGNIFSIGKPENGLNILVVYSGLFDENEGHIFFGLGYRFDISENFGLLLEYNSGNGVEVFENPSKSSFIIGGIRFHNQNTSWELGGMRPLKEDIGTDLIVFPFLKGTYYFH